MAKATNISTSDGTGNLQLPIVGMICAACVVTIEKQVRRLAGVKRARVNYASEKLYVEYQPEQVGLDHITQAVKAAGYRIGTATLQLGIGGMHCASCVQKIETELRRSPGVLSASVDLGTETAVLAYTPSAVRIEAIKSTIEKLGYKTFDSASPGPISAEGQPEPLDENERARRKESRTLWSNFLFAGILALPVVLFS